MKENSFSFSKHFWLCGILQSGFIWCSVLKTRKGQFSWQWLQEHYEEFGVPKELGKYIYESMSQEKNNNITKKWKKYN